MDPTDLTDEELVYELMIRGVYDNLNENHRVKCGRLRELLTKENNGERIPPTRGSSPKTPIEDMQVCSEIIRLIRNDTEAGNVDKPQAKYLMSRAIHAQGRLRHIITDAQPEQDQIVLLNAELNKLIEGLWNTINQKRITSRRGTTTERQNPTDLDDTQNSRVSNRTDPNNYQRVLDRDTINDNPRPQQVIHTPRNTGAIPRNSNAATGVATVNLNRTAQTIPQATNQPRPPNVNFDSQLNESINIPYENLYQDRRSTAFWESGNHLNINQQNQRVIDILNNMSPPSDEEINQNASINTMDTREVRPNLPYRPLFTPANRTNVNAHTAEAPNTRNNQINQTAPRNTNIDNWLQNQSLLISEYISRREAGLPIGSRDIERLTSAVRQMPLQTINEVPISQEVSLRTQPIVPETQAQAAAQSNAQHITPTITERYTSAASQAQIFQPITTTRPGPPPPFDNQNQRTYTVNSSMAQPPHQANSNNEYFWQRPEQHTNNQASRAWPNYVPQQFSGQYYRQKPIPINNWKVFFSSDTPAKENEKPAYEFLEAIEMCRVAEGLQPDELLKRINYLLRGSAYEWFTGTRHLIYTWDQFLYEFRQKFISPFHDDEVLEQVQNRKQGEEESVSTFISHMTSKFRTMHDPPTEQRQCRIIFTNLRKNLAIYHADIVFQSIRELEKKMRNRELMMKSLQNEYKKRDPIRRNVHAALDEPIDSGEEIGDSDMDYLETECKEAEIMYNENPQGNRSKVKLTMRQRLMLRERSAANNKGKPTKKESNCFNCKKPGHFYQDCTEKPKMLCPGCGEHGVTKQTCPKCSKNGERGSRKEEPENKQ